MKCHYEVLGVALDVNNEDLKKAYRKAALKWHPDKNLDDAEHAKEQFQLVQQAYEVLSDSHERAWYDAHRDAILKGGLGEDYKGETFDVFPYFTSSCFKGYDDNDKGFYSVYREVFNKIAAEDADYMEDGDSDFEVPHFGTSTSDFVEVVQPFYAYWQNYTTKKSYSWLDQYDIRDLPNRRVAKLVEKENKKIRDRARKDRNEQVRNLVAFVRKRDKRVQAQAKIIEQQKAEREKQIEEKRKLKLLQRQEQLKKHQESDWAKFSNFEAELKNIEKSVQAEHGDHESYSESGDDREGSDEDSVCLDNLYCPACQKLFKNLKAFANHENSKKHKENVEILKQIMAEEEGESCGDEEADDDSVNGSEAENSDKNENTKKIPVKKEGTDNDDDNHFDESQSSEEERAVQTESTKKKRKAKKSIYTALSDNEADITNHLSSMISKKQTRKQKLLEKNTSDNNLGESSSLNGGEEINTVGSEDTIPKAKLKGKKAKEARKLKKSAEQSLVSEMNSSDSVGSKTASAKFNATNGKDNLDSSIDTNQICVTCKSSFGSKNKLFEHLKRTGHSVYVPKEALGAANVDKKKGKGKKK